jgi:hypothetical protein
MMSMQCNEETVIHQASKLLLRIVVPSLDVTCLAALVLFEELLLDGLPFHLVKHLHV